MTPEASDEMEVPTERGLVVCPNPKCQRKIEQPILLSDLSTASAEQYYACPHCFIKLDAISTQTQKQKEKEKKREEPLVKPPEKEEKGPSRCAGYLGYLACRPKNKPIPRECLVCPRVLDCAIGISDS
ncbi:MAG: hypothetical protein OEX10_03440 [Candidatus Bathyarchaeota archaeon]|nr:hypothetical protein [Candidatus Bathyarchaeota archaeon]MDH5663214.1 hypothetical protein [Candidatus Bathyarchaeota archaeon]